MKKSQAFELLGGSAASAARLCRITPSAVSQWGEVLTKDQLDRACAAWARENVPNLPEAFLAPSSSESTREVVNG